jgi:Type VI secretion system/phage-baseplate injector OB domain
MTDGPPYLGKFRGTVVDNLDPYLLGRISVVVPAVSGAALVNWAMPCFPVAGLQNGFFAVPARGSGVWVEFEQGDTDKPIWSGCYWTETFEASTLSKTVPAPVPGFVLTTALGNGIVVSDGLGPSGAGGIVLKAAGGATIVVNDTGITISNGKGATIAMVGNVVDINVGALKVT